MRVCPNLGYPGNHLGKTILIAWPISLICGGVWGVCFLPGVQGH